MILGGSALKWGGTGQFYGVIYCEGSMDTVERHRRHPRHGDHQHATRTCKGTPNILYNDDCIANLDNRFPSIARRVKNSWREIQPQ